MTQQERLQAYMRFLTDEGFRPSVDADGDLAFKVEGRTYWIFVDEDEELFRVVSPELWQVQGDEERGRVDAVALRVTDHTKAAKVLTTRQGAVATIEMFASSPASVFPVFNRVMQAIQTAVRAFAEEMRRPG
jgi:hypothetical protein